MAIPHADGPYGDLELTRKEDETSPADSIAKCSTTPAAQDEQTPRPPKPSPANPEDVGTQLLRFLSNASNEMLGGILVGLGACTYLVLGRLGIFLIGALGGIVLHAAWEARANPFSTGTVDGRRETGVAVLKRVLDWREGQPSSYDRAGIEEEQGLSGFDDFRPQTAAALTELVDAVVRDYVNWWYHPIIPGEQSFPSATRQTLIAFLRSVSSHLSRKRPADTFLDFLTNSSSIVIVFLSEISTALSLPQDTYGTPDKAVQEYLSANPESHLANILNEEQQKKKFHVIAEDILQNFLEKSVYDCQPSRTFLREILGGLIMEMSLKACSKPEWLNSWIVYLLEDGEPDLIQAIDAGMSAVPPNDMDDILVNVGYTSLKQSEAKKHRKRLSKAEEAMEEAMEEAKRLSQLMAEEDVKRLREFETAENAEAKTDSSTAHESLQIQQISSPQQISYSADSIQAPSRIPELPPRPQLNETDQIVSQVNSRSPEYEVHYSRPQASPLSLHNASIMIDDDSDPKDQGRLRNKPVGDYLIQIEPKSNQHPGWMIVRKYDDFETLHEVLKRIAAVSGQVAFTGQHNNLPTWKGLTRVSLRNELQRYLRDACGYQPLADSEGMKRFLQRDDFQNQSSSGKGNFGWPSPAAFESMGKGMIDVLASAPKGAAEGGKVVLVGVTGVLGNIGALGSKKREESSSSISGTIAQPSAPIVQMIGSTPSATGSNYGVQSHRNLTESPSISSIDLSSADPSKNKMERHTQREPRPALPPRNSSVSLQDDSNNRGAETVMSTMLELENIRLPPPPSDIPDDYGSISGYSSLTDSRTNSVTTPTRTSTSSAPSTYSPARLSTSAIPKLSEAVPPTPPKRPRKETTPLTEQETRVAVEIVFAVITELYTLSSAWNIRRTLLTAAKTFLLRPGNPSLVSIQSLIQDSIIVSNTSDSGIATQLRKMRENSLPTEEELNAWPAELPEEEKQRLRAKARKLLIERGIPPALTGVMGQAATGEAMAKVFDCLQIEEVARGLMFGLLLQVMRAVTH